jgi:hypothetical protein
MNFESANIDLFRLECRNTGNTVLSFTAGVLSATFACAIAFALFWFGV